VALLEQREAPPQRVPQAPWTPRAPRTPQAPRAGQRPAAFRWVFPAISLGVDIVAVNLAFVLSYWLRYVAKLGGTGLGFFPLSYHAWLPFEVLVSVLLPLSFALAGVYRQRLSMEWLDEIFVVARAATVGMALTIIVTYLFKEMIDQHSRLVLIFTWALVIALSSLGRGLVRLIMARLHRHGWNVRRVVVAGSTPIGRMVMQNLVSRADQGYQLVGFLHEQGVTPSSFGRFHSLGSVSHIAEVVARDRVDEVVIALSSNAHDDITAIRDHCMRQHVAFKIVPDLYEMSLSRVRMDTIAGIPLIDVVESPLRGANLLLKRVLDVTVALLGLLVLAPLLALVALAIRLDSPGPIVIAQTRVGRGGHHFPFFKFRSMYHGAEREHAQMEAAVAGAQPVVMAKHKRDPRRTRVGRVIRKLSIDEAPQLLNVLRGEMSLVGPRPALPSEVLKYEAWHHNRFQVQPGMTGLWQVSGRSDLDFDEMMMMDIYYIDNWSLALDLKLLLRTPAAVLMMRGAY